MSLTTRFQHGPKVRGLLFIQMQLARSGSSILVDRRGFAPDEFCSSAAKAKISAKSQLVGSAVERAVAALHRLNAYGIAGPKLSEFNRPEERTQVVAKAKV